MPTIDTEPVNIGYDSKLVQNLGPGDLYIGAHEPETTGVKVSAGQAIAVGYTNNDLYAVSQSESDTRILDRGTGVFTADATE